MYRSELCIYHTEDRTLSPESQLIYKCMDFIFWKTDPLKEQCHEMDMFFKGLNILIVLSVRALMVFKVFQKLFPTLYDYSLFSCFF